MKRKITGKTEHVRQIVLYVPYIHFIRSDISFAIVELLEHSPSVHSLHFRPKSDEPFPISEPWIDEFFVVQERPATDFLAPKL